MIGVGLILLTLTHFSLLLMESERTQALLREQASRDSLTGARNRFALGRIEAGLQGPCALALIDIDHFKALNDGQGHATGDAVLRLLADLAQRELGERGMVIRLGGDEFAGILPGLRRRRRNPSPRGCRPGSTGRWRRRSTGRSTLAQHRGGRRAGRPRPGPADGRSGPRHVRRQRARHPAHHSGRQPEGRRMAAAG
jgi:GGDEF domain-containing protein